MSVLSTLVGNLRLKGRLIADYITQPAESVGNAAVKSDAGVSATKLEHQHQPAYAQESATTAAAETRVVHVVRGAIGTTVAFEAGCITPCLGNATITVDLLKNGASVLTAAITLDNGQAAYDTVEATIDDDALADDDVLEVDVSVNAGTGTLGEGVFAGLTLREDPN